MARRGITTAQKGGRAWKGRFQFNIAVIIFLRDRAGLRRLASLRNCGSPEGHNENYKEDLAGKNCRDVDRKRKRRKREGHFKNTGINRRGRMSLSFFFKFRSHKQRGLSLIR